jgi:hypothetical protein
MRKITEAQKILFGDFNARDNLGYIGANGRIIQNLPFVTLQTCLENEVADTYSGKHLTGLRLHGSAP